MTGPARTCPNCGATVVEGDSFCGVCGEFLEWEPDLRAAAVSETAVPETAVPETAVSETAAPEKAVSETAVSGAAVSEKAAPEKAASETAVSGAAVSVEQGGGRQPGEVLPGRPVSPRPTVREFAVDPTTPDDVSCRVCGTGNRRDRRFCRRCGNLLVAAEEAVDGGPWWRRLPRPWPRLGLLAMLVRLAVLVVVVAIIVAAGYLAVVFGPRAIEAVRDRTATPERTPPATVTASSEAPGHPAGAAVDGLSNRYWAPAVTGPADGQFLEMTFEQPIRLLEIIVHAGVSTQQEQFAGQARPQRLDLTTWTSDGASKTTPLRLADRPGEQQFHHAAGSVTRLRLTIRSSYGATADRHSAVAEVEFFRRP